MRVVGHSKMINSGMVACSDVPCNQVVYRIQKGIVLPGYERRQKGRPYRTNQSLKYHICSEVRVVGHPKMIKFPGGRLLCCHWCSDMFIGYKKAFFSQQMDDGKAVGRIEKSNPLAIIFALELGL